MPATNFRVRLAAALLAILASATVLGSVTFGMQSGTTLQCVPVVAMEQITVSAPRLN
jgi:hypothetical protein